MFASAAVLLLATTAWAQNELTIPELMSDAGDTITVEIVVVNADPFVALQLSIPLPSVLRYVPASAVLTARADDHALSVGVVSGDTLRILAYSGSGSSFAGSSGAVLTLRLVLGSTPGTYALDPTTAVIADPDANNILTSATAGTVTVQAPRIQISQDSLIYSRTIVGEYQDQQLRIENTGNVPLSLDSLVIHPASGFEVVAGWSDTLAAGSTQFVSIRFQPSEKGLFLRELQAWSDDPAVTSPTVGLRGIGYKVNELHVNSLSARSGTDTTLSLRINNQEPFIGFQFDLPLPDPVEYLDGSVQLTSRADGHAVSANVVDGSTLRVVSYSPDRRPFLLEDGDVVRLGVHVDGRGGPYGLPVANVAIADTNAQNVVSDSYGGDLVIAAGDIRSDGTVDFGAVSLLDTAHASLAIQNVGNDTLVVTSLTTSSPSRSWAGAALPLQISPYQQISVPMHFHSDARGQFSDRLRVRSNDPDEDPYYVDLVASAYAPNRMHVVDGSAFVNERCVIDVAIDNYDPVSAWQLDLQVAPSVHVLLDSCELSERSEGHTLSTATVGDGQYRFVAFSTQGELFTGASGTVLHVACRATTMQIHPVTIDRVVIANEAGSNVLSSTGDGSLEIQNRPPTLAPIGDQEIAEGDTLELTLSASDSDGDALSYLLTGAPAGAILTDSVFSWTPSSSQVGLHSGIAFTVSDGRGGSDSETITVTVNNVTGAVVAGGIAIQSATVQAWDAYPSGSVAASEQTDAEGRYSFYAPLDSCDLRVYAPGHMPARLPRMHLPISAADVTLDPVSPVLPADEYISCWSENTSFLDAPIQPGDVVMVYDADGVLCGWCSATNAGGYGPLHAHRDDPLTATTDEGAEPGEQLRFGINGTRAEVLAGNPLWTVHGAQVEVDLRAPGDVELTVPLAPGWNLISWGLDVEVDSMAAIARPVEPHLVRILGFETAAINPNPAGIGGKLYNPRLPAFVNTLKHTDGRLGYWFRMAAADTLVVAGVPCRPSTAIPLTTGFNLIAYLPDAPDSTRHCLGSRLPGLLRVLGFESALINPNPPDIGAKLFSPTVPEPVNTLQIMTPRLAYWVVMSGADVLRFPDSPVHAQAKRTSPVAVAPDVSPSPTNEWIGLYGAITVDGTPASSGTSVQVVDGANVVCGAFVVHHPGSYGYLPVYRDDADTDVDEGAIPGEWLSILLDDAPTKYRARWTSFGDLQQLDLHVESEPGAALPRQCRLHQNCPNPFNHSTRIYYDLDAIRDARLTIYNLQGQQIWSERTQAHRPGVHAVLWDGRDAAGAAVASGVYLYRLQAGDYDRTRKMLLAR